jgi:hypothetical protein
MEDIMRTSVQLLSLSLLGACAKADPEATSSEFDSGAPTSVETNDDTTNDDNNAGGEDEYLEMDDVDNSMCGEDYSVCGDILIPSNILGEARSIAVVLYQSVPPAGPPDGIVAEIENPNVMGGYRFPIRELPVLFTGEYYLWVNLYMEGGGEWVPVNGVDYTGYTTEPMVLDGSPISFDDINLELASGW